MRSVARGHRGPVYKVRLSDDGRRMVTIGGADGRALLWDTFPDREVATIGPLFSSNLIFGPSLSEIKQVALDSRAMRLVLLAEDTPYVFSRQDNRLMPIGSRILIFDRYKAVCVSPDGRFVLLTGPGNEPSIHNVDTGEPVLMLRGHTESVSVAQYNQSATRVVTVGEDRTLRVWDVASGKQLASMETGDKPALAAIFSPDGRHVVSTGEAPKVWSADGRFVAALGGSFSAMFNDDGTKLWTTTANAARAWNTRNWRLQAEVLSPFRFNYRTIPLRGDYILFSENKTGQIQLVAPQNQAKILVGHKATVTAAALSPDHSRLITGDETGKVIVWLTSTGAVTSEISDHTSHVTTISFSRNGRFFATGSKDGTVRLYALAVNDLLQLARSRLPNGMATGSGGEK
jgi:WD40 repeat protein